MIGKFYIFALVATQLGTLFDTQLVVRANQATGNKRSQIFSEEIGTDARTRRPADETQNLIDSKSSAPNHHTNDDAESGRHSQNRMPRLWSIFNSTLEDASSHSSNGQQCRQCRSQQHAKQALVNKLVDQIKNVMNWREVPDISDEYINALREAKLGNVFSPEFQADQPQEERLPHYEVKEVFIFPIEVPRRMGSGVLDALKSRIIYYDMQNSVGDEYDVSEAILRIQLTEELRDFAPSTLGLHGVAKEILIAIDLVVTKGSGVTFKTTETIVNRKQLTGAQVHVPISKLVHYWMQDPAKNNMGLQVRIKNVNETDFLKDVFVLHQIYSPIDPDETYRNNNRLPKLMLKVKKKPGLEDNRSLQKSTQCPVSADGKKIIPTECCAQEEELVFSEFGMNFVVFPESVRAQICIGPCGGSTWTNMSPSDIVRAGLHGGTDAGCCSPQRRKSLELLIYKDSKTLKKIKLIDALASGCSCH